MSHKRHKIRASELQGFKYFDAISGMLESLHDAGCEHDRAGNRILHMDQYVCLLLLHMFNPICTSLRSLQQASELKKVQAKLGVPRASLGSLSEASTVFDSQRMLEIIDQLGQQLEPITHADKLKDLPGILTAVDGTLLKGLPKIAWALWIDDEHKAVKNHVHFEILKAVPVKATITEGNANEKEVLAQSLEAGRIYVLDRGYAKYSLLQDIVDHHSSFVCRIRDNYGCEVIEERPITADGQAAGVVRDRLVRLGGQAKSDQIAGSVRVVEVQCRPHVKRMHTGRGGPEQSETLALATDLLDVEADVIALIFQHRWTIEIYQSYYLLCHSSYDVVERGLGLTKSAA